MYPIVPRIVPVSVGRAEVTAESSLVDSKPVVVPRESEVQDFQVAVASNEKVLGLHIAMDDALGVRGGESSSRARARAPC